MDIFPPAGYIPTASTIEGIEVYQPAPAEPAVEAGVTDFVCPQCGATTAYSVAEGGLKCSHCGYYEAAQATVVGKAAEQLEFTVETLEKASAAEKHGWGEERQEIECQNCGACTAIPLGSLTHTCPFCGSNKVIQRQASQDMLRPRYLIPFRVDTAACQQIVARWLSSSWMTPSALRRLASLKAFVPVYLPFWAFHAVTKATWSAEVGHTVTERHYSPSQKRWVTRIKTVWRRESGSVRLNIDDVLVEGTSKLSALLLGQIKNFDLRGLVSYEAKFLAGMHARAYDVPLEAAWATGRERMRERTRLACRQQASSSQIRNFGMSLDFSDETWRYILLPVYVAAYTYQNDLFQVFVNGQNGAIAGQRPVDWGKVWLAIAALLSPGVLLSLIGLVTLLLGGVGVIVSGIGFILLAIGVGIAIWLYSQATQMDDA